MKQFFKLLCVALMAVALSSCNPMSKIKLHGVARTSVSELVSQISSLGSGSNTMVIGVDMENQLGLNVKATEAKFELREGERVFVTATLAEPVKLRHNTRDVVDVKFNVEMKGGLLQTIALARTVMQSPEKLTVSGYVVGKCAGIKKKKTLSPQPLSNLISKFANRK